MGWGELDYKRLWCNHIHNLEHYILFPNNSFQRDSLWPYGKVIKPDFKACLISSKLNKTFNKTISLFDNRTNYTKRDIKFKFENPEISTAYNNLIPIDLANKKNTHFKVILNDFVYKYEEHCLDVKLYRSQNEDLYKIKGKNHCKKVVFIS